MNLTIFAATGGVGRELLEQAGAVGHDVTAAVRNPGKLTGQVRTVTADLAAPDPAALESAVAGAGFVKQHRGRRSRAAARPDPLTRRPDRSPAPSCQGWAQKIPPGMSTFG